MRSADLPLLKLKLKLKLMLKMELEQKLKPKLKKIELRVATVAATQFPV